MSSRHVRVAIFVLAVIVVALVLMNSGLVPNPLLAGAQGEVAAARSDRPGRRVLFIGNSFTYHNAMPRLVDAIASSAARDDVFIVQYARPNWSLRQFARDRQLHGLIEDIAWDDVVLQDRSYLPALRDAERESQMDPFAADLDQRNRISGANTVLFMTWAYRDGADFAVRGDTFDAMNDRIENSFAELGAELPALVAPVGTAWAEAVHREPSVGLWAEDGRHPSPAGSYLTACVFYAVLFDADPRRTTYNGDLRPEDARFLQDVAADVVTSDRG